VSQADRSEDQDAASFAEELKTIGDERRRALFNEAWLILAAVDIVAGLIARQDGLSLLGVFMLVVSGLARLWNRYVLRRVSYGRTFEPRRAFIGETVELTLTVENRKLLPVAWLRVEDEWPGELRMIVDDDLRGTSQPERRVLHNVFSLRWYERVRRRYTILCEKRGYYRIGPARATSGDIFGMLRSEYTFPETDHLLIYPQVLPIEELGLPPKNPFGEVTAQRQIFEDPARTIGVRDHQPEDGFRRIHWKATARKQALQSKLYEPTTSFTLIAFVNVATFDRYWYGTIPELLERNITVAASICAYAAERRYVLGLVANGSVPRSDQPIKVAPGRSPQQLSRVLEALAVVTPVATQSISSLLTRESPRLPWGATLIVVTAHVGDELNRTLLRLHDAGRRMVLVSLAEAPPEPLISEQILTYHLPDEAPSGPDAASPYSPLQTRAAWQLSARTRRESVLTEWATGVSTPAEVRR
jgi:uncharacterized protein (DUF58 family)